MCVCVLLTVHINWKFTCCKWQGYKCDNSYEDGTEHVDPQSKPSFSDEVQVPPLQACMHGVAAISM